MDQSLEDLKEYHFVDDDNNHDADGGGGATRRDNFVIDKDLSQSKNLGAAILLSDKTLPEGFEQHEISYDTLASLGDKDLELLGIENKETRSKLMDDFKNLPNQIEHLDQYLARTNLDDYKSNILGNMAEHLDNLKTSLSAAELKLMVGRCEDVLIGDTTYSSELVLRVLNEMNVNANCIEQQLMDLKTGKITLDDNEKSKVNKSSDSSCAKCLIHLAMVSGMLGLGLLLFKLFKQSKLK